MDEEQRLTVHEWHRRTAAELFNFVWSLLEKDHRTKEEDDAMLHAAHASRFHWSKVGTAVNLARGDWQLSRVYSVLRRAEPALYHAGRCLEICQENVMGDFDLAFAYEALARASAVAGKSVDAQKYLDFARHSGKKIADHEDREWLFSNLATISGFDQSVSRAGR